MVGFHNYGNSSPLVGLRYGKEHYSVLDKGPLVRRKGHDFGNISSMVGYLRDTVFVRENYDIETGVRNLRMFYEMKKIEIR